MNALGNEDVWCSVKYVKDHGPSVKILLFAGCRFYWWNNIARPSRPSDRCHDGFLGPKFQCFILKCGWSNSLKGLDLIGSDLVWSDLIWQNQGRQTFQILKSIAKLQQGGFATCQDWQCWAFHHDSKNQRSQLCDLTIESIFPWSRYKHVQSTTMDDDMELQLRLAGLVQESRSKGMRPDAVRRNLR